MAHHRKFLSKGVSIKQSSGHNYATLAFRRITKHTLMVVALGSVLPAAPVSAQIVSYDGNSFPEDTGWIHEEVVFPCDRWIKDGRLFQFCEIVNGRVDEPEQDIYRFFLNSMVGTDAWFIEWKMKTNGPPVWGAVAPAAVAAGGFAGVLYHITIGDDEVRLIRDPGIPIVYAPLQVGTEHKFRLELDNIIQPPRYVFFVDGALIDQGEAEGVYPDPNGNVVFRGKFAVQASTTQWDFVRLGRTPDSGSGDYDSNGSVGLIDHCFLTDCLTLDGPGIYGGPAQPCPVGDQTCPDIGPLTTSGPGCVFVDMDGDLDADLHDVAAFQRMFEISQ